jgi:hypothetical protein
VLAVILALGACSGSAARADVFRISVGGPRSRPLASDFLGLALEYRSIPALVGSNPHSVNPVLVHLIGTLTPRGPVSLRIGGQSTDRTWWPVAGLRRPPGITYDLTPRWMARTRALAQAIDARMILGVGLEADRTAIDAVEAKQLLVGISRQYVAAMEIGNEPELYTLVPWYRKLHSVPIPWYSHTGTPVFARPSDYGPADFYGEFSRTLRVMPRVPIAGPETGLVPWIDGFRRFVSPRSRVRIVTWHAYGLNQCVTNLTAPDYPTVPNLLSARASRGFVNGIGPYVASAHRAGATFRVDEMGSVTCNGRLGVSNTFASALWVMDALFTIAADGVDGVNIHTFQDAANGLLDFDHANGQWQATVHPIYYGLEMFAHAAPAGSRLLHVYSGPQNQFRSWATRGPDHRTRVLLINDSLRQSTVAEVRAPSVARTAQIESLRGPSAYATDGVSIGDKSFGVSTSTGLLPAPRLQSVAARSGVYAVSVPPSSAALITMP